MGLFVTELLTLDISAYSDYDADYEEVPTL